MRNELREKFSPALLGRVYRVWPNAPASAFPLLLAPLLAACSNYNLEEMASDQSRFAEAFVEADLASMEIAAENFRTNFSADNFRQSARTACARTALSTLGEDVPAMQRAAIGWVGDKSAERALAVLGQLDDLAEIRQRNFEGCSADELEVRGQVEELETLLRADIQESYDIDALLRAEEARQEALLAERLASCNLEEWRQRLLFRSFVWEEDIYGLEDRQRVISEVAQQYKVSGDCVERIVRNATVDHPEWIPEPL